MLDERCKRRGKSLCTFLSLFLWLPLRHRQNNCILLSSGTSNANCGTFWRSNTTGSPATSFEIVSAKENKTLIPRYAITIFFTTALSTAYYLLLHDSRKVCITVDREDNFMLLLCNNICINVVPRSQDNSAHSQGSEPVIYLPPSFWQGAAGKVSAGSKHLLQAKFCRFSVLLPQRSPCKAGLLSSDTVSAPDKFYHLKWKGRKDI